MEREARNNLFSMCSLLGRADAVLVDNALATPVLTASPMTADCGTPIVSFQELGFGLNAGELSQFKVQGDWLVGPCGEETRTIRLLKFVNIGKDLPNYIEVAVVCRNASGEPDVVFCLVKYERPDSYEEGEHYEAAIAWAKRQQYEGPFTAVDRNDPGFAYFDKAQIAGDIPTVECP